MPSTYVGVQNVINVIDGYKSYLHDIGWRFNEPEANEIDLETGQLVGWQTETERLINRIYSGLGEITAHNLDPIDQNARVLYAEVNPFRNNIWFNTEQGIITNIHSGPYTDIRVDTTLYDQSGTPLPNDSLHIFRSDRQSRIRSCSLCGSRYVQSGSVNFSDDETVRPYSDPHIGGVHLFIDGYEHTIMFNDYTADGYLIHDSYLGLSTGKFSLEFEKNIDYTYRPNIGGYYLNGTQMVQNIENAVENIQYYYDTHRVNETSDFLEYARALLGYTPPDYLDVLGVGSKSKFVFWRGMIQNKGAVSAVSSFINARLFVDAKVDEFWAYKVGEYGNVKKRTFNDLLVQPNDVRRNELRLQFADSNTTPDELFVQISPSDQSRWVNFPDQEQTIDPTFNFYFDVDVVQTVVGFHTDGTNNYIITEPCNDVSIVKYENSVPTKLDELAGDYTRINSRIVQLNISGVLPSDIVTSALRLNTKKYNPAKLIDQKTQNVVSSIFVWNPGVNEHYHVPMKLIDVRNDVDPAKYSDTFMDLGLVSSNKNWNANEVGTVWLRTNSFDYVPYYDNILFPSVTDRLYYWGKATEWSTFDVLQWTESPVLPSDWTNYVSEQASNNEVDLYSKPSGSPMRVIYKQVNVSSVPGEVQLSTGERIDVNPLKQFDVYLHGTTNTIYELNDMFTDQGGITGTTIAHGQPIQVYVNGFWKGTVSANSVISSSLIEPPTDVQDGDIYVLSVASSWGPAGTPRKWDETTTDWVSLNSDELDALIPADLIPAATDGRFIGVYVDIADLLIDLGHPLYETDTITFVYDLFGVDVDAVSTDNIYYTADTPYTQVNEIDNSGNIVNRKYYFWVENKNTRPSASELSLVEIKSLIINPSVPYMFTQGYKPAQEISGVKAPARLTRLIVRGISNLISDFDRYRIRINSVTSLRDDVDIKNSLTTKNVHEQWEIFRKNQPNTISRTLWNKLTESVVGYKLNNSSVVVPATNRVLYDQTFGTMTRIGFGDGQTFVDKEMALTTIVNEIENPNFDLYPIDKSSFLSTFNCDTPENVLATMNYIYNTFPSSDTNRIFFACLHDALSLKSEYGDLMKTSAISLHGIKILETADRITDD